MAVTFCSKRMSSVYVSMSNSNARLFMKKLGIEYENKDKTYIEIIDFKKMVFTCKIKGDMPLKSFINNKNNEFKANKKIPSTTQSRRDYTL